jgi:hypothetical protein
MDDRFLFPPPFSFFFLPFRLYGLALLPMFCFFPCMERLLLTIHAIWADLPLEGIRLSRIHPYLYGLELDEQTNQSLVSHRVSPDLALRLSSLAHRAKEKRELEASSVGGGTNDRFIFLLCRFPH